MPASGTRFDIHLHLSKFWPELRRNSYGPTLDFTTAGLLKEMDAQGIGQGLLIQINESPTVEENLEEGARLRRDSGGRLLRSSTVDPTRAPEEVRQAVERWENEKDLVALKLFPGYQHFYPHDARLDPFYEFAHRRNLLVMVHQGDTMDPRGLIKYARPVEMDEVAVRYRDVRFVLCHMGNPWVEECAEVVYKNENVYADTSGLLPSPLNRHYPDAFLRTQRRLTNALASIGGPDRILYGSDWPLESLAEAVRLIEGLPIPEADREMILGGNARTLLKGIAPSALSRAPA